MVSPLIDFKIEKIVLQNEMNFEGSILSARTLVLRAVLYLIRN